MPKFHSLRIKDVRPETNDCVSVSFEVPDDLKQEYMFIPGQHLTLRKSINGEDTRRSYSICSSPSESEIRIAIKRLRGGIFSNYANDNFKAGDLIEVMPPVGHFHAGLQSVVSHKHNVAFVAGSGITPILSILKATLEESPDSRFTLFYGNRTMQDVMFLEELEGLKNRYVTRLSLHYILSQENPGLDIYLGRLNAEKCQVICQSLLPVDDVDEFFICGPSDMIDTIKDSLISAGVESRKIRFERFTKPGQTEKREPKASTFISPSLCTVTLTLDGKTFSFGSHSSNLSILEAAQGHGSELPFACKAGVCCTCRAKLLEGKVDMDVNYGLEKEEIDAGYILTCQAHPLTEKVVLSFDE